MAFLGALVALGSLEIFSFAPTLLSLTCRYYPLIAFINWRNFPTAKIKIFAHNSATLKNNFSCY